MRDGLLLGRWVTSGAAAAAAVVIILVGGGGRGALHNMQCALTHTRLVKWNYLLWIGRHGLRGQLVAVLTRGWWKEVKGRGETTTKTKTNLRRNATVWTSPFRCGLSRHLLLQRQNRRSTKRTTTGSVSLERCLDARRRLSHRTYL